MRRLWWGREEGGRAIDRHETRASPSPPPQRVDTPMGPSTHGNHCQCVVTPPHPREPSQKLPKTGFGVCYSESSPVTMTCSIPLKYDGRRRIFKCHFDQSIISIMIIVFVITFDLQNGSAAKVILVLYWILIKLCHELQLAHDHYPERVNSSKNLFLLFNCVFLL